MINKIVTLYYLKRVVMKILNCLVFYTLLLYSYSLSSSCPSPDINGVRYPEDVLELNDCINDFNSQIICANFIIDLGFSIYTLEAPLLPINNLCLLSLKNGILERNDISSNFRLLEIKTGTTVNIYNLVLRKGLSSANGGAIYNEGELTIESSTLNNNSAQNGGAIFNQSTLTITNSTLAQNTADSGGAIYNNDVSNANINNSTIAKNSAILNGGGIHNTIGNINILSTIISSNNGGLGPDLYNKITTMKYSLIGSTLDYSIVFSLNNIFAQALIGPLQQNGGFTPTIAILPGSLGMDTGYSPAFLLFDQRGSPYSRKNNGLTDMGAYQHQECKSCKKNSDCVTNNPCLDHSCKKGVCYYTANNNSCNDNNQCTINDQCKDGNCEGTINPECKTCQANSDCNDNDLCTSDICISGLCSYAFNSINCDDNNQCTESDKCVLGTCTGAPSSECKFCEANSDCDDNDLCTNEQCIDGLCTYSPKCSPASGCNTAICVEGNCIITIGCIGNTCNDAACIDGSCVLTPKCDDNNKCTVDQCVNGACSNTPVDCNDGQYCTNDACDQTTGNCLHTNKTGLEGICDDLNSCTFPDICTEGICVGTPSPSCNTCTSNAECNDNLACTDDVCEFNGICVNYLSRACDDLNLCTNDQCTQGGCTNTPIPNCTVPSCFVDADCPSHPCSSSLCLSGECVTFEDNSACGTVTDCVYYRCQPCFGPGCNTYICIPTDICPTCSNNSDCDDLNACTIDTCNTINQTCSHTQKNCDDNNPTTLDCCRPSTGDCYNNLTPFINQCF